MTTETQADSQEIGSNEVLILMGKGDLRPLIPKFKELGGFYTGLWWVFPPESEPILSSIVGNLPGHWIKRNRLAEGKTFEGYRQEFKAEFFKKLLRGLEGKITQVKNEFSLEEFSEKSIQSAELDEKSKEELLMLLQEEERLKEAIEHRQGLAKVLVSDGPRISIEFLCDRDTNFIEDEAPPMPRLVNYMNGDRPEPFIPKGVVGMLAGAGGVGKTHALAQLAIAIATGSDWLGIYPVERPGYAFLALGENADPDIHRLIRKVVKNLDDQEKTIFADREWKKSAARRLATMSFTGMDSALIQEGMGTKLYMSLLKALKDKQPEEGWSLIILDPISRFLGADAETDNAAATQFIALLEKMILELKGNPTIIFGHHMNKSAMSGNATDQGAARGSSAITDGVRFQINLERVKKAGGQEGEFELSKITMRHVKSNFTAILPPQTLDKGEKGFLTACADRDQPPAAEQKKRAPLKKENSVMKEAFSD